MSRYVVSPEAREDLKKISRFIAKERHAPQGARRLCSIFLEQFRLLALQPLLGELREDLGEDVRQWTVRDYAVFYESADNGVHILQVIHGARDIPAVFRHRP